MDTVPESVPEDATTVVPNLNPPAPLAKVSALVLPAVFLKRQMHFWPSVALVGAFTVTTSALLKVKTLPSDASVSTDPPITVNATTFVPLIIGDVSVLLVRVCAFVLNVNSSTTPAKSGIVSVVPPTV